ncbi:hypothetical protein KSP40_PGU021893 [Platanthera guangdongensis]|uniref:Uncharacterized protein n=1 Tax=Platanthera guangdongensis TaxID=2320717 RepID=A0ABR2MBL0_9ASPA
MHLCLGEIRTIIFSSQAAKEIMKTHDLAFASRPLTPFVKIICYGCKGLIVAPFTEYWRKMCRLCTSELPSTDRVLSFRSIREEEISLLIRSIAAFSGVLVNLSGKFAGLSNDIMTRAVFGGRNEDQMIYLSALGDVVGQTLSFSTVDLFPSMFKFIGLSPVIA